MLPRELSQTACELEVRLQMLRIPAQPISVLKLTIAIILSSNLVCQLPAATARETLLATATTARQQAAEHPHSFRNLEIFDVASAETVAGAGFLVVAAGEKIFAVTAKHPHAKTIPTDFLGATNQFRLKEKTHEANDALAFKIDAPGVPAFRLMPKKSLLLRAGDPLSVVCHDGVRSGKLTRVNLGMDGVLLPGQPVAGKMQILIPGKHTLDGNSGAPVILEETGEVVGILIGALAMGRETAVDFVLLSFDPPEPRAAIAPPTVFSLKAVGQPTGRMAAFSASVLPPELFAFAPGMQITNILQQRPFLPDEPTPALLGSDYNEVLPDDYPFRWISFTVKDSQVLKIEASNNRLDPTAHQVEALFDFFCTTLGAPAEAFSFGEHRNRPGHGSVYCQWTNAQTTVILGAYCSGPRQVYLSLKAFGPNIPRRKILEPAWITPISSDRESLRSTVQKLARQTAALDLETGSIEK